MKFLEEKILSEGRVLPGEILKVDGFLNHQIDMELTEKMAEEIRAYFLNDGVTKVLTIEASGIALAAEVARLLKVPMLFAKKGSTKNLSPDFYSSKVYSYTHAREYELVAAKAYLKPTDKVLIIDDFLALGNAIFALNEIINLAKATLVGVGIAIEKGYQGGGDKLRKQGIKVLSLAIIDKMTDEGEVFFRKSE